MGHISSENEKVLSSIWIYLAEKYIFLRIKQQWKVDI